jgi:hypothetical protein
MLVIVRGAASNSTAVKGCGLNADQVVVKEPVRVKGKFQDSLPGEVEAEKASAVLIARWFFARPVILLPNTSSFATIPLEIENLSCDEK